MLIVAGVGFTGCCFMRWASTLISCNSISVFLLLHVDCHIEISNLQRFGNADDDWDIQSQVKCLSMGS